MSSGTQSLLCSSSSVALFLPLPLPLRLGVSSRGCEVSLPPVDEGVVGVEGTSTLGTGVGGGWVGAIEEEGRGGLVIFVGVVGAVAISGGGIGGVSINTSGNGSSTCDDKSTTCEPSVSYVGGKIL